MTLIADLLSKLEVPGTFATRMGAPSDDLELDVEGVGRLRLPITPQMAHRLRAVARLSPYGLREQTLYDPSVRNSWELPASKVKISGGWKSALAEHLRAIQAELGLPKECELKAELDKLLIYEPGQFFKSHQDSEKRDTMVATLVVVLPSDFSGGALTVEHRGESKTFRRLESQATDLSLFAFYADCHHAVSPIKRGVRLALTYRLMLKGRTDVAASTRADLIDRLTERVREHFAVPVQEPYSSSEPAPPQRLVYLLDHEYTQRSLSWRHLKNGDRVRVAALRTVAERLDCEFVLALAETHETWTCEEEHDPHGYGGDRWGRRGWEEDEDLEDDECEPEEVEPDAAALGELVESEIQLYHWLGADGEHIQGIRASVREAELHFTKHSRDVEPFKSEYEGYQGNYGNTVDRWYHRAAFVMWPRANTFALKAQASPQWAVDQLCALPPRNTAELESKVKTLLQRWSDTAGDVQDAHFFAKLIKLSTRLDDAALSHRWLSPLGAHRLRSQAMRRNLVVLIDKHGLRWAQELFATWTRDPDWELPAWAPLLADLCADLCATKHAPCEALAEWLVGREANVARGRCAQARESRQVWLDLDPMGRESTYLAHVLAAAVVSAPQVYEETLDFVLGEKQRFSTAFLVQLFQACIARSPALRARVTGSLLHRACVERLETLLRTPERASGDWAIDHPLRCRCADCRELAKFLRSKRAEYDWPLGSERRRHIHGTIDTAELPVLHTTLRRGRPYVLQLRKSRALFTRERAHRARVKKTLSALPALRSR